MKKKTKAKKPLKSSKLPTFEVPTGTPMIPWDLAQKIWEEEGLEDMETAIRLRGK
jgi:hypothetical protein